MRAATWPNRLLSLEDWAALPEDDSRRVELMEGTLRISPQPRSEHQYALMELACQLRSQLPEHLVVLPEVEVAVFDGWPATVRVPDLVVVQAAGARENPAFYRAADVLVVVEVLAPGSVSTDRVTKFHEYRTAGIPHYWLVDLNEPVSIAMHQLVGAHYVPAAQETAATAHSESPAPLSVEPAALRAR